MLWTKLLSWIAGRWLPLLVLGVLLAGLVAGYRWAYGRGEAAVEARWAAQAEAARVAAAEATARQNDRLVASNGALADAQARIAALDHALGVSVDRLREYAARPRDLPAPPDYASSLAELAAERDRAASCSRLLAEGGGLIADLARERDDAVARLWAAADAWPR